MTTESGDPALEQPTEVAGLEPGDEVELTLDCTIKRFRGPPVAAEERVVVDAEGLPFPVSVDPDAEGLALEES